MNEATQYKRLLKRGIKEPLEFVDCECGAFFPKMYWKYCPKCKKTVKEILLKEEDKEIVKMIEYELADFDEGEKDE